MFHHASVTPQVRLLCTASFIAQFSIAMANLALVFFLRENFSLQPGLIGLSVSTYTGAYLVCCILFEKPGRSFKPRYLVMFALAGMAISVLLVMSARCVGAVFSALVCYGASMALLWPQIETWLSRGKNGEELNSATSGFNVAWSLGAALAPMAAGFMLEYNTRLPLIAAIVLFVFTCLIVAVATVWKPSLRAKTAHASVSSIDPASQVDCSTPIRFLSWANVVASYVGLSLLLTIFPLHASIGLGFSESRIGFLLLLRGLATCVMFMYLGGASWWQFSRKVAWIVHLLLALICVTISLSNGMLFIAVGCTVFGMLFAVSYTASIFHGASGSIHHSRRMMIHESLLTLGAIIGSTLGGWMYERTSFALVMQLGAILLVIPTFVSMTMTGLQLMHRDKHPKLRGNQSGV